MARIRIKNWSSFQHYKGRRPPWIKLHHALLDDYDFHRLHVASRALAPCLWLLASESDDGAIDYDVKKLAFRLHLSEAEVEQGLNPLIEAGFVLVEQDASTTLADCKHDASEMLCQSREETETEKRQSAHESEGFNPTESAKFVCDSLNFAGRDMLDTIRNAIQLEHDKFQTRPEEIAEAMVRAWTAYLATENGKGQFRVSPKSFFGQGRWRDSKPPPAKKELAVDKLRRELREPSTQ